ncbi:MAG: hypothetical protein GTN53_26670 [Candidatus Aminicenantes bacterium]|nr:hypothetical protein [Candidatus Aminicenantes bacterium]NIT26095.1 hypothetical protein [Candidatus Aminicenantes bacterium]
MKPIEYEYKCRRPKKSILREAVMVASMTFAVAESMAVVAMLGMRIMEIIPSSPLPISFLLFAIAWSAVAVVAFYVGYHYYRKKASIFLYFTHKGLEFFEGELFVWQCEYDKIAEGRVVEVPPDQPGRMQLEIILKKGMKFTIPWGMDVAYNKEGKIVETAELMPFKLLSNKGISVDADQILFDKRSVIILPLPVVSIFCLSWGVFQLYFYYCTLRSAVS